MTVVCDLCRPVGALRSTKLRGGHAICHLRIARRRERRPEGCAGTIARARGGCVLLEQVERSAACVDEDATQRRVRYGHLGRSGGRLWSIVGGRAVGP